jgi:hypothetical protein
VMQPMRNQTKVLSSSIPICVISKCQSASRRSETTLPRAERSSNEPRPRQRFPLQNGPLKTNAAPSAMRANPSTWFERQ